MHRRNACGQKIFDGNFRRGPRDVRKFSTDQHLGRSVGRELIGKDSEGESRTGNQHLEPLAATCRHKAQDLIDVPHRQPRRVDADRRLHDLFLEKFASFRIYLLSSAADSTKVDPSKRKLLSGLIANRWSGFEISSRVKRV